MTRRADRLFLLGLPLLVAFLYAPGLYAPPAYDDTFGVLRNPRLASAGSLLRGFLDPLAPVPEGIHVPYYGYRPLTEASFALTLGMGTRPPLMGCRAANILIHAASACLVFWIARLSGPPAPGFARLAALFFAVHPVGSTAVTYVYQRFVGLEALLAFLCMGLYWTSRGRGGWRYAGALAAGLLAAGAKETAATLPLLLAALEWIRREPGEPLARVLKRWLPFLLVPGIVLVQVLRARAAQLAATQEDLLGDFSGFRRGDYALLQLPIVLRYASLAAWPFPLRFFYDRFAWGFGSDRQVPLAAAALCGAALALLVGWILLGPRRHALPRLGSALFLAPLALECSVFPTVHLAWNHRFYPGLLGAGLAFAWAASRLGRRCAVAAQAALLLLAASTLAENRLWRSPDALARRDVRHAFHDPLVWHGYAQGQLLQGRPGAAVGLLRHVFASPWHTASFRETWIRSLLALGREEEAHRAIAASLGQFPHDPLLLWTAVEEAIRLGDPARLDRLAAREPLIGTPTPELAMWLADRHAAAGGAGRAETALRRALDYFPGDPRLWECLGRALTSGGRLAEAEAAHRQALALAPAFAQARLNLAALLVQRRDLEGAEAELRAALEARPDYAKAREALAAVLALRGRP